MMKNMPVRFLLPFLCQQEKPILVRGFVPVGQCVFFPARFSLLTAQALPLQEQTTPCPRCFALGEILEHWEGTGSTGNAGRDGGSSRNDQEGALGGISGALGRNSAPSSCPVLSPSLPGLARKRDTGREVGGNSSALGKGQQRQG